MASKICILLTIAFAVTDGAYIVGGSDAKKVYPYQVSLRLNGFHTCSGSVLNNYWVMTAAHCLKDSVLKNYAIVVATQYSDTGGYAYRVEERIVHPKYGTSGKDYDIGLLRTRDYMKYSDLTGPIALPTQDIDERNATALLTGWGHNYKYPTTHILQVMEVSILEVSKCQQYYTEVTPLQLCTLNQVGQGFCDGDSGSPLVLNGQQIGIGSWGSYACAIGTPDVFTRVFSHIDWIKSHIE